MSLHIIRICTKPTIAQKHWCLWPMAVPPGISAQILLFKITILPLANSNYFRLFLQEKKTKTLGHLELSCASRTSQELSSLCSCAEIEPNQSDSVVMYLKIMAAKINFVTHWLATASCDSTLPTFPSFSGLLAASAFPSRRESSMWSCHMVMVCHVCQVWCPRPLLWANESLTLLGNESLSQ